MRAISFLKIPVAAAGLSALLFTGCLTEEAAPSELEGSASITVVDANTGLPVHEVKVEVVGGASKRTSEEGQARLGGLRLGTHQVLLSKAGYESSQEPLVITSAGTLEVVAQNVAATYRVHKQGPSIKGRVLMRPQSTPDTTAIVPAKGVIVELRLAASGAGSGNTLYTTSLRTVTTDSNGYYTFQRVPEISSYAVAVPEFNRNGRLYSQPSVTIAAGNLVGPAVYPNTNIVLSASASGTLQVFPASTTLVANQGWLFEFSAPIDTSKFVSASAIQLRANAIAINAVRTWSQGFKVLSIRPATGTWVAGTPYSVALTGVRDSTNRVLGNTVLSSTTP